MDLVLGHLGLQHALPVVIEEVMDVFGHRWLYVNVRLRFASWNSMPVQACGLTFRVHGRVLVVAERADARGDEHVDVGAHSQLLEPVQVVLTMSTLYELLVLGIVVVQLPLASVASPSIPKSHTSLCLTHAVCSFDYARGLHYCESAV